MTNQQRREYSQTYIHQQNRLERKYVRQIFNALHDQVQAFVDDMNARSLQAAESRLHVTISNEGLMQAIRDLHVESGLFFGRRSYYEIRRSAKRKVEKAGFGMNAEWTQAIINWFAQELFALVSNITETTRQQILKVLSQAVEEGWSNDQIVKALQSPELLAWRARLIARTELGKGAFIGRKLAADDSEWEVEKEWVAANDHRTRHSHRTVDGDVIPVENKFQVQTPKGGVELMEGPGDPSASAANICNCRCSMSTRAKRDENGRLIPKTKVIPLGGGQLIQTA